ncbi:MAG TPA: hypothetical protein PLD04_05085 [Thermoanaerobaculia bacterium]|nr:hypothetical protein [Thermoanaerobaculia bacterium]
MATHSGKLKPITTITGQRRPETLVSMNRGQALKLSGRILRGRA